MPLSEHEQRLLDQMEQALYAEDPKFVSHMHASHSRSAARRRVVVAAVGILAGLAVVLFGVTRNNIWLGAVGFAVMVAAGAYAAIPRKDVAAELKTVQDDGSLRTAARAKSPGAGRSRRVGRRNELTRKSRGSSSGSFMQRMEERWERRRYDGNW